MVYLKSCIRCKGDIHTSQDWYGKYVICMQCGYTLDLPQEKTAQEVLVLASANESQTLQRVAS